jgi:hypothetical protein
MTFDVEVVLRGRDYAVTEQLDAGGPDPNAWADADVQAVLFEILRAIERADNPDAPRDRMVALRGVSWIVEPSGATGGVVIAIEIPMGAAVAGPFAANQAMLEALIGRVMRGQHTSTAIH